MAEDKNGFVLYADLIHTIKKMSKDDRGDLFLHILQYVNDENPETDNAIVDISFEPIKQQLKRDLVKWGVTREGRSKAGKASAEARRVKKEQEATNPTSVESVQQSSTNSTVNDTVNVNATVNDTKDKKKPKNKFSGFKEIKESFESFYNHKTQGQYYWTAKDAGKVNPIISKLRFKIKEKSGIEKESDISDADLIKSFEVLLTIIKDEWILSNLSMAIIDSKFNEIMANRNGGKSKSATGFNTFTSIKVPND